MTSVVTSVVSSYTLLLSHAVLILMFLLEMKTLQYRPNLSTVATHSSWRLCHCFALEMACVSWIETYLKC